MKGRIGRLIVLVAAFLAALPAVASTTVTGHFKDASGTAIPGSASTYAKFTLMYCGANQPKVSGTTILGGADSFTVKPDSSGVLSVNMYGNDVITCGSTTGNTRWSVVYYVNNRPGPACQYNITGAGPFNLDSQVCSNTAPTVTAPTGDATYLRLDAGNSPVTGPVTFTGANSFTGANTHSGTETFSGALNASAPKNISNYLYAAGYGLLGDGVTDNTTAFNTMVADACPTGATMVFGPGKYLFSSKPNAIGCGAWLVGASNGTNGTGGTILIENYTEGTGTNGLLTWDGSSGSANGTGGGISNLTIWIGNTFTGGAAIKLTGTDDNHRAGWWALENSVVTFNGTGTWTHTFYVDGSCCTTASTQGVRDIFMQGVGLAGASGDQSLYLYNTQHFVADGLVVVSGTTPGLTVTGGGSGTLQSNDIHISNSYINGNLVLDYVSDFNFTGGFIGGTASTTVNTGSSQVRAVIGSTVTNTGGNEFSSPNYSYSNSPQIFNNTARFNKQVGIGGAAASLSMLDVYGTSLQGVGDNQIGVNSNTTFGTDAVTNAYAFHAAPATAANEALTNLFGYQVSSFSKGTSSTVTNQYGYACANSLTGATNNWCFYSGTGNQSYFGGTTIVNGAVSTPNQLTSTLATGTSPLAVSSTTVNTNLNADLLDGFHAGNSSTGHAMCWKDATHMGYCSTQPDATGSCTCN